MSAPWFHRDGVMSSAEFRRFVATATYAQAENSLRLDSDQWEAFRAAWLLSAFHYADCFIAARAKLSAVIAECAK